MEDELDKLEDDLLEVDGIPPKKVPYGDVYEAARAGDVDRLRILLDSGVNVNARDPWDSVALYYACLAGHVEAARMLLDSGAICSEHTFDGDRCHYAALNLRVRRLLQAYEARPLPLPPLADALRSLFFRCGENHRYLDPTLGEASAVLGSEDLGDGIGELIGADIVFHVEGRDISAHRAILAARSPFFRRKFEKEWRFKKVVRFARDRLSFSALFSLISFFYCDKLDVLVDDMKDLARICKACGCFGLQKILEKEMLHQKYAEYKSYKLSNLDDSVRRFILQGSSLPEEDRLPAAMDRLLRACLDKSGWDHSCDREQEAWDEDFADACFVVEEERFRCHKAILAARSDYVRAILGFRKERQAEDDGLQVLEERDLSMETFVKVLSYMYTDVLEEIDLEQAEELLDAASRYLLFPLKRLVADVVLSYLENATPPLVCQWLIIADVYGVTKIREHCLDVIAANFETFACESPEFKSMIRGLPPPSGDSSTRTSAPGAQGTQDQGNLLDDLRETWLNAEGAELHERDQSAKEFDKMLELLMENVEDDDEEVITAPEAAAV